MPDGLNNVDSTLMKLAEQYQASKIRSKNENDERANIRENVEKLGVDPDAFQVALRMARDKTKGERSDFTGSLDRVLGMLDGKEAELFGADDIAARDKRAEKREAKKAGKGKAREQQDDESDKNKRSNPAAGGAGKGKGKGKAAGGQAPADGQSQGDGTEPPPATTLHEAAKRSDAAIADSLEEINRREQQEGADVLDQVGDKPVDNVVPMSQSQKADAARSKAGLN